MHAAVDPLTHNLEQTRRLLGSFPAKHLPQFPNRPDQAVVQSEDQAEEGVADGHGDHAQYEACAPHQAVAVFLHRECDVEQTPAHRHEDEAAEHAAKDYNGRYLHEGGKNVALIDFQVVLVVVDGDRRYIEDHVHQPAKTEPAGGDQERGESGERIATGEGAEVDTLRSSFRHYDFEGPADELNERTAPVVGAN